MLVGVTTVGLNLHVELSKCRPARPSSTQLPTSSHQPAHPCANHRPLHQLNSPMPHRAPFTIGTSYLTMAFRASLRRVARTRTSPAIRSFHTTHRAFVKAGDELPDFDGLFENSPGNKVNLAEEFNSSNGYIVGVPGAFTGTCSSLHVPSYINHPGLKKAGQVFVVSVNDPFV